MQSTELERDGVELARDTDPHFVLEFCRGAIKDAVTTGLDPLTGEAVLSMIDACLTTHAAEETDIVVELQRPVAMNYIISLEKRCRELHRDKTIAEQRVTALEAEKRATDALLEALRRI